MPELVQVDFSLISRYFIVTYNDNYGGRILVIIAVFGDIHGNARALKKVLEEIDSEGILSIFHTGDCVCGHTGNREVIEVLEARGIPGAKGLWDHNLVRYIRKRKTIERKLSKDELELLDAAYHDCPSPQVEFLSGLPRFHSCTIDGIRIAVCHGTLSSPLDSLEPEDDDGKYMRQREQEPAHLILSGKTHVPHTRRLGDTLYVNPGSVGMNDDGLARYAIISTEAEPWTVEFREIPVS
jgi:predicted phosphodiesterase